jgi:6,7-dimethyl-8-ribityllumazine synthase
MRQRTEGDVREIAGLPYGDGRRIAVITAASHPAIVGRLTRRAVGTLLQHEVRPDDIHVVHAPGVAELPTVARWLVATDRYDAIVAVGLVVRPDTPNADEAVAEAGRALAAIAASLSVPIAAGVVACANWLHVDALTRDGPRRRGARDGRPSRAGPAPHARRGTARQRGGTRSCRARARAESPGAATELMRTRTRD